ncbi:MAG TPA: endo-1,4-beta-xylanase [Candidatus Saccharimonadales bacterium]|nr:endo-1,4-beta-xylanase [Candidatus Saccharimonadales bacterium]
MENLERNHASLKERAGRATLAVLAAAGVFMPAHVSEAEPLQPNALSQTADMLGTNTSWNMPGAIKSGHQLNIKATGLGIVNQDGTPNQTNPPVNLYGSRLNTTGAFSVTTTMSNIGGQVQESLYGTDDVVEDEWRAPIGNVTMRFNGNKFAASVNDQKNGTDGHVLNKTIKASSSHTIKMTDKSGKVSFAVDGKSMGSMPDDGIFNTHKVWVGMDALSAPSGKFSVTKLQANGESGGKVSLADTRSTKINRDPTGFQALASKKRPGLLMGSAVALGPMVSDPTYDRLLGNEGLVSVENAGKWQNIEPEKGKFNFKDMDAIVDIARKSGMKVHGHALVFTEAQPTWMRNVPANQLEKVMTNHIKTVVGHYKGKVSSWDVVNEPLADDYNKAGQFGLRENNFYKAMGPDYVEIALRAAHAADPSAKLYLNDYGMESDDNKFQLMNVLSQYLTQIGAPLNGIGFEAHLDKFDTNSADTHIDEAKLEDHFQVMANLGLKVRVSELDVSNPSEYPALGDAVKACVKHPNCESVTTWGITNRYSSGSDTNGNDQIQYNNIGLPYDKNEKPISAAIQAIKSSL